jgi:hypothetical protein
MTALPATTRAALAKILGELGSCDPARRDLAARNAHRLVTHHGTTWRRVLNPPAIEKRLPELGTWRRTVKLCLAHPMALKQWEAVFLKDLPEFRRLSVRQRYVLKQIADRVLGADRT